MNLNFIFWYFSDPSPCDPMNIDEHFRRSLGNDYDLIIRNKLQQEHLAVEKEKQRILEEQLLLQQQQQEAAAAAALLAVKHQHQSMLKHHKKHQIHQHQAMMVAKHNPTITTPPSTPSPPIHAQHSPISVQAPNVISIPQPQKQQQVIISAEQDNDEMMSVDDHFAKALGEDTWKQFSSDRKWVLLRYFTRFMCETQ